MFEKQELRSIEAGKDKLSAYAIIEWLRWEVRFKTDSDDEFKINNHFRPIYARLFALKNPLHKDVFNFKETKHNYDGLVDLIPQTESVDGLKQYTMFK